MPLTRRPTVAEINLDALRHNFSQVRTRIGREVKILAVVKANAYGHGAVMVSRELEKLGVDFLGVATCEEGIALRKAQITVPIIILGGFFRGQARGVMRYHLTPVIYTMESAEELAHHARRNKSRIKIHVKIDTGMGRLGIMPGEIKAFFEHLIKLHNLEIEGVLSHLADNNQGHHAGTQFTQWQLEIFKQQIEQLHQLGSYPRFHHLSNSSAIIEHTPDCFNLVRPGIMLYGAYPAPRFRQVLELKPVLNLKTKIISLKTVPKGTTISYGRTYRCERESLIATLPIGYADGYSRHLSNKGEVLVRGTRVPVVGVVCMDMLMIDVTEVSSASLHDEVVLIGSQGAACIDVEEVAQKIDTISYEVLCGISSRVPRVYLREGKLLNGSCLTA